MKNKVHVTTFKQRAKRIARTKKKEIVKKTKEQENWFDNEFNKLKNGSYWTMGY